MKTTDRPEIVGDTCPEPDAGEPSGGPEGELTGPVQGGGESEGGAQRNAGAKRTKD